MAADLRNRGTEGVFELISMADAAKTESSPRLIWFSAVRAGLCGISIPKVDSKVILPILRG
jgi:hypothetical protein